MSASNNIVSEGKTISSVERENLRVLVVDDDGIFRDRLVKALQRRSVDVVDAGDVQRARDLLSQNTFTHALIDLNMPGEDGLSFLRFLRAQHAAIQSVVLTGYGSIATALEAVRIGAKDYLTKPCDARRILDALGLEPFNVVPTSEYSTPSLSQVEWDHIQRVLHDHDGNITQAAKVLGMHRRSLQRKLLKAPGRLL